MSGLSLMGWKDLQSTIATAEQIFDVVRLVDPLKACLVEIDETGNIQDREQKKCFSAWNFASRCGNCTSLCAYDRECMVSKTERMGNGTYHVLSYALEVEDWGQNHRKLVLEMLSETLPEEEKHKDTVLVVDDQDVNRMIIRRILEKHYHVIEAADGKAALEVLEENYQRVSAVVLDLVMPKFDGYTTLRFMRCDARFSNIPVLVTTGDGERKTEKKSLEAGAWDFIPKPVNKDTLELRLKNIIGRSQFDYQKTEQYIAEHDRLTGLYNRSKLFDEVRMRMGGKEKQYAFLRVDLDRFRLYNAFFGEQEGNRLLLYLASLIREETENMAGAVCGRIEADIFAMFCLHDGEKVARLQQQIVAGLKEYNEAYYIQPSIGVYLLGEEDIPVEEMYDRASMAAESCKHKYMENIAYYDEKMARRILGEQEVMNEAEKALETEQFEVYLQPKIHMKNEEMCGAEALCRWRHPKKGVISPGKFVPVFENNGFIGKLDFYMWERTCQLLRRWLDGGLEPKPISVNVSRANLYHPNLLANLMNLLHKYGIPPRLLQLELTESAFMDDQEMMIQKVEQLQQNGFTVLMDDFGSGYSSLNTLKDIPVDILKVDMKFLGEATGDGDDKSERILASVVRMAAWLGLEVIIEGVETGAQRNFLENIGCEYAQGYFYAKPMPWQEYEEMLRELKNHPQKEEKKGGFSGILDELWEMNGELERVFFTMTESAALFRYDGKEIALLKCNGEFGRMFGYDGKLVEGGDRYLPDNYVASIRKCFGECASERKMTACDFLRIEKKRENSWYRMRLQYVTKVDDNHVIMAVVHNISQEKMLEQEVRRYKLFSQKKKVQAKMLVVDDSSISRFAAKELFKDRFEILEAADGKEAIHILSHHYKDIAIILLDMIMPVMDGRQFLELKNSAERYEDIPVVVVSADDRMERQIDMLQNGVNDYVTKPFVPEIVERRVLNVIEYNSRFRSMLKEYQKNAVPVRPSHQNGD